MIKNHSRTSICALAALALTACGGGGGGGTNTGLVAPVALQATSPIVTSIATPTYTGEELIAFNVLNAEREHCGFGKLAQNAKLDVASTGHVDWMLLNNYYGHNQVAGLPGFTGVSHEDRIAASGYARGIGFLSTETLAGSYGGSTVMQGEILTRDLLNSPFHELVMLRGFLDVGLSFKQLADNPTGRFVLNINYASSKDIGLQTPSSSSVRTYPCDGSTGIRAALYGELPSPVPGRDFATNPLGTSIAIFGDIGKPLIITSATMTSLGGAAVPLRAALTSATDTNGIIQGNEAVVSADVPLAFNTAYQVNITGSNGGVVFSRNFSFVTGAN
jgi:uncharacterized protein YkwD